MCARVCRYASLYFCCAVEEQDNELITLEVIHRFVELLDKYFGSVSHCSILPFFIFIPSLSVTFTDLCFLFATSFVLYLCTFHSFGLSTPFLLFFFSPTILFFIADSIFSVAFLFQVLWRFFNLFFNLFPSRCVSLT